MKSLEQHAGGVTGQHTTILLHSAASCNHKVVLPVLGSKLTLAFSSGSCEGFSFMFCPEFLRQGVDLKTLGYGLSWCIITASIFFLNDKSEKPLEFFVFHIKI